MGTGQLSFAEVVLPEVIACACPAFPRVFFLLE